MLLGKVKQAMYLLHKSKAINKLQSQIRDQNRTECKFEYQYGTISIYIYILGIYHKNDTNLNDLLAALLAVAMLPLRRPLTCCFF